MASILPDPACPSSAAPSDSNDARQVKLTLDLFGSIRDSLTTRGIPEGAALRATYFVFSTWFADRLPFAPCLLIAGPRPEGRFLLELLACLVWHPLPIGMLTQARFLSLPLALEPTLLIDDERIGPSTWELVRASNRRNSYVPLKDGLFDTYCAKAIYCGNEPRNLDESTLKINLQPSRGRLPVLEASEKILIADELRP